MGRGWRRSQEKARLQAGCSTGCCVTAAPLMLFVTRPSASVSTRVRYVLYERVVRMLYILVWCGGWLSVCIRGGFTRALKQMTEKRGVRLLGRVGEYAYTRRGCNVGTRVRRFAQCTGKHSSLRSNLLGDARTGPLGTLLIAVGMLVTVAVVAWMATKVVL